MQPYSYQSLAQDESIRLLFLQCSDDWDSPIQCKIETYPLYDAPLYEAISYTWGASTSRVPIYINSSQGQEQCEVTLNGHNALRRLRPKSGDRAVWIDAVCINQEDQAERSQQVRMMGSIFAMASLVVVYLGEHTPDSRQLFKELEVVNRAIRNGKDYSPEPSRVIARYTEALLERSWFSRIWVIQEVRNSKSIIMCGDSFSSWDPFYECRRGHVDFVTSDLWPWTINNQLPKDYDYYTPEEIQLWYLLMSTRSFQATDKRDRIFALIPLIEAETDEAKSLVNYNQTPEEVYINTAQFLFRKLNLLLIAAIRHPISLDMPTWVPDWSQDLTNDIDHYVDEIDLRRRFKASESYSSISVVTDQTRASTDYMALNVKGVRYVRVSYLGEAAFEFTDFEDAKSQLSTICSSDMFENLPNNPSAINERILQQTSGELFTILKSMSPQRRANFFIRGNGPIPVSIDAECVNLFRSRMEQCKLFLTDNDLIGITSAGARNGDVVFLLQGAWHPCLLRRDTGDEWRLVSGDCYLDGSLPDSFEDLQERLGECVAGGTPLEDLIIV
ncbi:hypothetical protein BP6252_06009 [Coleophoma cylindrospora]|uniref:Heterokaryon incompatibility domain-containing protein n=1 Tax=Coleophoma cylindrospora TaxID=1849047 RepID=A0A3D8RLD5_9HELO|nr:hypothetical protein BP6252_06009 [Coleophoma cylindrospora]